MLPDISEGKKKNVGPAELFQSESASKNKVKEDGGLKVPQLNKYIVVTAGAGQASAA